jgi:MFS family permease
MRQVLNIFSKDVRHYWRECAASIALVAGFAWNEMRGWLGDDNMAFGIGGLLSFRFLSGLVVVLLPIAWSFLVVRVIQGESLVGDRQFWVTRPYEWKKLLTAKVLFVLTFVNLPLLVLDVFLLEKAGFTPTNYVIGLLWMQLMIALYFVLPFAALATVTATVAQMLLALLIIVLYGIGMGLLSDHIPSSSFSGSIDSLTASLLVSVCLAVTLIQFARRKTKHSRLIVGLAGAFLVILVATPYETLVVRQFPQIETGQTTAISIGPSAC